MIPQCNRRVPPSTSGESKRRRIEEEEERGEERLMEGRRTEEERENFWPTQHQSFVPNPVLPFIGLLRLPFNDMAMIVVILE